MRANALDRSGRPTIAGLDNYDFTPRFDAPLSTKMTFPLLYDVLGPTGVPLRVKDCGNFQS